MFNVLKKGLLGLLLAICVFSFGACDNGLVEDKVVMTESSFNRSGIADLELGMGENLGDITSNNVRVLLIKKSNTSAKVLAVNEGSVLARNIRVQIDIIASTGMVWNRTVVTFNNLGPGNHVFQDISIPIGGTARFQTVSVTL